MKYVGIGLLIYLALAALSWLATCFIIWLITALLGWTFNWWIASAIWLVMLLLKNTFTTPHK